jgi:hypothetical protein
VQFQLNKGTAKDVAVPKEQVATSAKEERPVVTFKPGKTVDAKAPFNEVAKEEAESDVDNVSVEEALEKASKRLQHNHRAVTREDYEWLAKEASRAVARAKCIPNLSGSEEEKSGCVSVIIVPQGMEDRPTASPELLRMVEGYLKSRSPISVSSLTVKSPLYLQICVTADLYVTSIDSASTVKAKAIEELKNFLHPLHGGYRQMGWDFGEMPSNSDIHKLLQKIPEVDRVENLSITVKEERTGKSFVVKHDVSLPTYTLICSDKHQIKVRCVGVR